MALTLNKQTEVISNDEILDVDKIIIEALENMENKGFFFSKKYLDLVDDSYKIYCHDMEPINNDKLYQNIKYSLNLSDLL